MYTGGAGGEFLSHWLGSDIHGQNPYTRFLPNNRFNMPALYNVKWQIDNNGSDQPMFYPCHPDLIDSKLKEYINNGLANLFVLDTVDICYYRYYFFLFLIKTLFLKHSNFTPKNAIKKIQSLPAPYNCPDKLSETVGRSWHYNYELDHYINQDIIPPFREAMPKIIDERIANGTLAPMPLAGAKLKYNKFFIINSKELYFDNTQNVYNNICTYANIQPVHNIDIIKTYVQKNIDLVEKYSGLSFDAFLNIDDKSIKYILYNMLEKHHNEEYQNTP